MSNNQQQPNPSTQQNNNQNSESPKKVGFQRGLEQHLKTVQQLAPNQKSLTQHLNTVQQVAPKPSTQQNTGSSVKKD